MDDESTASGFHVTMGEHIGSQHHEVSLERLRGVAASGRDHVGAEGEVRYELTVHDVPLEVIDTGAIERFDLLAEAGEITRQDRRNDLDGQGHIRTLAQRTSSLGTR
jgi:hypothetical protein